MVIKSVSTRIGGEVVQTATVERGPDGHLRYVLQDH
jgi:hypothetical protein